MKKSKCEVCGSTDYNVSPTNLIPDASKTVSSLFLFLENSKDITLGHYSQKVFCSPVINDR